MARGCRVESAALGAPRWVPSFWCPREGEAPAEPVLLPLVGGIIGNLVGAIGRVV